MKTRIVLIILIFFAIACNDSSERSNTNDSIEKSLTRLNIRPNEAGNALMLSDRQIRLANITTKVITPGFKGEEAILNGKVTINEQQSRAIISRIKGRIEKLYVNEIGQSISQRQPLYSLYSEALITLEQEYILARENYNTLGKTDNQYHALLEAAEKKLLNYGLTKNQINQLKDINPLSSTTFLAPVAGVVTEISIAEGSAVQEGSLLYKIEDLTKLWVEVESYLPGNSSIKIGDKITVKIIGDESNAIDTKIAFLNPAFQSNTQMLTFRAPIDNKSKRYKPGQQAQVYVSHSSKKILAIPTDAVIRDGNGAHVYIQKSNNTYVPQHVKTGLENFDQIEIREGIKEGDTVVTSSAYLLYSDIVLKKGSSPIDSHNH